MLSRAIFGFFHVCAASAHGATLYVSANGAGNCSTWGAACSLSSALSMSTSGDQIWVKAGTYVGPIGLVNAVKLIGGFAGSETAASQSNPVANVTILDGSGMDRVIYANDCAASTIVRGFTIQNGRDGGNDGGGAVALENSSVTFVQCVFKNNSAAYFGGVVAVRGSGSTQFINCKFHDNGTGDGASVQPLGGGVAFLHSGAAVFTNCLFYNNKAGEGGVSVAQFGLVTFLNCTLAQNTAELGSGGAIFDQNGTAAIRNSIVWGNSAESSGGQIYTAGGTTITYSNVEGGFTGTGNINANPQFINAAAGNFDIPVTSPCKDVANSPDLPPDVGDIDWDANVTEVLPKDLNLDNRKIQFQLDIGAYEAPASIE